MHLRDVGLSPSDFCLVSRRASVHDTSVSVTKDQELIRRHRRREDIVPVLFGLVLTFWRHLGVLAIGVSHSSCF